ncbi:heterotrimeric G-protein alpha subunit, GPA1-like protein [Hesseltinella vesiculosa]|uniref:Heterotrimeric G-protein alpha subunit, GPA1-like protein n=1 Tax=Hesseltinella vesiculosa TaxID=101127 RepID=A0A1X2GY64_9FUNG|nr:heterotrimeric G-protein alpha subunit, GPA1-like protein [Hesseltinella vesiculosa]
MGGCLSKKQQDDSSQTKNAEYRRTIEIENSLHAEKLSRHRDIKLLLLGAGEAGKSTFLKQIRLIHEGTYSAEERQAFREIVVRNVLQCMLALLDAAEMLGLAWQFERSPSAGGGNSSQVSFMEDWSDLGKMRFILQQQADRLLGRDNVILLLPAEIVELLDWLWHHNTIKTVYNRRNEYQLNDSAAYYLNALDRIGEPSFVPTDQDILRSRVKTTGIVETSFMVGHYRYHIIDIGGQRSERKKWIHYFDRVTAVIFMVALSEYDQVLYEDSSVNRLQESLNLFKSIWNSTWFRHTSFVLLLNKTDLFLEKWSLGRFQKCFPKYQGPNRAKDAQLFLQQQFEALKPDTYNTQLYSHFTTATDTENVRFVLAAVSDTILQEVLQCAGLLD